MSDAPNYNNLWSTTSREKDQKNSNQLSFGVFNRIAGFSVFMGDSPGRPKFKHSLNNESIVLLEEYIDTLLNAKGEHKEYLISTKYNMETKQSEKISQITFIRDEKGIFHIECYNKELGSPVMFTLRSTTTYTTGGDGISVAKKSELAMKSLKKTLQDINLAKWNSPAMAPNRNGGGKFGGNNGSNSSGSGGSKPSGGDDLFD